MKKNIILKNFIGGRIINISRICNLLSIRMILSDNHTISLHVQSFFRIMKRNKVVVSSEDMYRCSEKISSETFEWDVPGNSIFDETLQKYHEELVNSNILQVRKSKNGDLLLVLENGIVLQILIDTAVSEEKYRIFDENFSVIVNS